MPPLRLRIRQADIRELGQVLGLYNATSFWPTERGIKPWPYPLPQVCCQHIEQQISCDGIYVARLSSKPNPAGVIYLTWSAYDFWPEDDVEACYLYGLATHPRVRGLGVGSQLLAWAERHASKQRRACLRLDCSASNMTLRQYYRTHGFQLHGLATSPESDRALYEKQLIPWKVLIEVFRDGRSGCLC